MLPDYIINQAKAQEEDEPIRRLIERMYAPRPEPQKPAYDSQMYKDAARANAQDEEEQIRQHMAARNAAFMWPFTDAARERKHWGKPMYGKPVTTIGQMLTGSLCYTRKPPAVPTTPMAAGTGGDTPGKITTCARLRKSVRCNP